MKFRVLTWKEWDPENSRGDIWVDFSRSETPELRKEHEGTFGRPSDIPVTTQLHTQCRLPTSARHP